MISKIIFNINFVKNSLKQMNKFNIVEYIFDIFIQWYKKNKQIFYIPENAVDEYLEIIANKKLTTEGLKYLISITDKSVFLDEIKRIYHYITIGREANKQLFEILIEKIDNAKNNNINVDFTYVIDDHYCLIATKKSFKKKQNFLHIDSFKRKLINDMYELDKNVAMKIVEVMNDANQKYGV